MNNKVTILRTKIRAGLAFSLIIALVLSLFLLLTALNDPNPNAALTALLGSITGALGTGLVALIGAIAGTTMENEEGSNE
ncbi:MAG: hypothetical protein V3W51_04585 [Candidatus Brocadiales bacterium]